MRRLATLAAFLILIVGCGGDDGGGDGDNGGDQSVFSLPVGTCFDDQEDGEITSVPAVDCSAPHDNEVFALIDYTESDEYPGSDEMSEIGTDLCIEEFEAYVGLDYPSSELAVFAIYPTEASWNDGDREVICNLYDSDLDKLTGSMQGAAR